MDVTIYHNPACSKSRAALSFLHEHNIEPTVIEYLENAPTAQTLAALLNSAQLSAHQAIRTGEPLYKELGLSPETPENQLVAAMAEHPILIERPLVVTEKGARIARPAEVIQEIL
ncbi:arsenate reductase (glutaredoxin) [Corynebacterium canis]|uniref:Arsenate reductase (Glutaredoxin) n=1 Tax=Corynebacterium canis TaxID=679663 RepID=A0A5C5UH95_9CORY|nr:arsenate reductase (glutaredoxin) [Corynebacterium canis]TWT24972.1 arsenate reductase (glutaredoxin) [Corynebacterium canis]WJY74861.1 Arsenate reductase [Corynebacterium canis]